MILFAFDPIGGFIVGDTKTKKTSYCFPNSMGAMAATTTPEEIAGFLMDAENQDGWASQRQLDENNWKRLSYAYIGGK